MKLLALALLAAVGFAGVVSTHDTRDARLRAHFESVAHCADRHCADGNCADGNCADGHCHDARGEVRRDDEPPPVDCPFCGGNPTQHLRNMRRMFVFQSRLILGAALSR